MYGQLYEIVCVCVLVRSFVCTYGNENANTANLHRYRTRAAIAAAKRSFFLPRFLSIVCAAQFELIVPMCIVLTTQNQSAAFYFHICISNVYF